MSERDDKKSRNDRGDEAQGGTQTGASLIGRCYEICIGAKLDESWSEWFEGLEMHPSGKSWTVLCGRVADQAALLGILNKLCRLNVPLVSVNEVKANERRPNGDQEGGE